MFKARRWQVTGKVGCGKSWIRCNVDGNGLVRMIRTYTKHKSQINRKNNKMILSLPLTLASTLAALAFEVSGCWSCLGKIRHYASLFKRCFQLALFVFSSLLFLRFLVPRRFCTLSWQSTGFMVGASPASYSRTADFQLCAWGEAAVWYGTYRTTR